MVTSDRGGVDKGLGIERPDPCGMARAHIREVDEQGLEFGVRRRRHRVARVGRDEGVEVRPDDACVVANAVEVVGDLFVRRNRLRGDRDS